MDYEGLIDDNRVLISLIACSMNYETAVTFTYGHFNKVVFAVYGAWRIQGHASTNSKYVHISGRTGVGSDLIFRCWTATCLRGTISDCDKCTIPA